MLLGVFSGRFLVQLGCSMGGFWGVQWEVSGASGGFSGRFLVLLGGSVGGFWCYWGVQWEVSG